MSLAFIRRSFIAALAATGGLLLARPTFAQSTTESCRLFSPSTDFTITVNTPGMDAISQCADWVSANGTNPYFPGAGTWAYDTQPSTGASVCVVTLDSYGDTMHVFSQTDTPSLNGIATCSIYAKHQPGGATVEWAPGVTPAQ
jgi:hypothetical protein